MKISVIFEALTGSFETDVKRASKVAEQRAREIEKSFQRAGQVIGAGLAVGATALAALTKKAIDTADEMSKLAQSTGISTEALSQLQYAAGLSGVEDLGSSLLKFNKSIAEAADGSKAQADAFKLLGVDLRELDGSLKPTEDLLLDVAEAFQGAEDNAAKTALAMDLFGRSGAELIPFLNAGRDGLQELQREADAFGLTLSERTGKAAENFNDNMSRLGTVATGLGARLAAELAPELERMSGLLVDAAKDSGSAAEAADVLATGFKGLILAGIGVSNAFQIVGSSLGAMAAGLVALGKGDFEALTAISLDSAEVLKQDLADITNAYTKLFGEIQQGAPPAAEALQGLKDKRDLGAGARGDVGESDALKAAEQARKSNTEAIAEHINALREELAVIGLTREQIELRTLAQRGATAEDMEHALQILRTVDAHEKLAEAEAAAARLYEETRTPLERLNAELERLNELRAMQGRGGAPVLDEETYTRGVIAAQKEFDRLTKAGEESTNSLSVFADQAARNMQDAFADFLFDPFEDGVRGMVRSFAQALQRMAANAIAERLFEKILPPGGASGGGGGGLFSSLFSLGASAIAGGFGGGAAAVPAGAISSDFTLAAGGGLFSNVLRDAGGYGRAGQPTMIGTGAQPEMFIPQTPGTFTPASEWMQPPTVNLRNINAFDTQVIADFMATPDGEQVVLNIAERNSGKFKALVRV